VLLDVSESALTASAERLSREYPQVEVRLVVGDFERDLALLGRGGGGGGRLAMLLGGTVGNLAPETVPGFLGEVASALERGDGFLVGVDLEKDPAVLEAAYDDPGGVTADFNRNVLRVVNDRLGGDFEPEAFAHVAFYDRERRWIEMRLRATRALRVRVRRADLDLRFAPGDEIRTEISCKYTRASFDARIAGSGLAARAWHEDPGRFALALLSPG
jgi:L-histidine N-alpha-methyltransferase